jgi:hypothetical protein
MEKKAIELTGIGGGPTKIETERDLLGYSVVYYHPDKIETNTLSALCSIFLQKTHFSVV